MAAKALTDLAVALCICAVSVPGCNRKAAARGGTLGTNQQSAERAPAPEGDPARSGLIERVSVALHTGTEGKAAGDAISVRLYRGNDVVAEQTVGMGEPWAPGSFRALEIPVEPGIPPSAVREMRLELVKNDPAGGPGSPWSVQVEALGQLEDGRVIRLLEPTTGAQLGGQNPFRRAWMLTPA